MLESSMCSVKQVEIGYLDQAFKLLALPDYVTSTLVNTGTFYEIDLLEHLFKTYGTGGVYVDFGAFIGTHSLFFSRVCKADLVIAVEPHPTNAMVCLHNLRENGCVNADVIPMAAGESRGRVTCPIPESGAMGGINVVLAGDSLDLTVPMIRSGDLITAAPKLIKIDCESSSIAVLRGCLPEIKEYRSVVVIESHGDDKYLLDEIMDGIGYVEKGRFCASPTYVFEAKE